MQMTRHAELRRTQRNIPMEVVEAIYAYGSARYSRGATSLTLDRNSIALASDGDARLKDWLGRYLGIYLVVGLGERVATAARAKRHFRIR